MTDQYFTGSLQDLYHRQVDRFHYQTGEIDLFLNDSILSVRQVQVILADSKSQELLETLKRDRSIPSLTTQDYLNSRHNAEKVLGPDENLFRIDWVSCFDIFTL